MTQVVVIEFDEMLRGTLHDLLTKVNHYDVTEVAQEAAGVDYLTAAPGGMVVLVSNQDADHHRTAAFFAAVAADERLATGYRYILLSTNPRRLPRGLPARLKRLHVRILTKPFDVDTLLAAVHKAEARLVPLPALVRHPA